MNFLDALPGLEPGKVTRQDPSPALPTFEVAEVYIDDEKWLEVRCVRRACPAFKRKVSHMVHPLWRKANPSVITRSCPYCFKVSKMPPTRTGRKRKDA